MTTELTLSVAQLGAQAFSKGLVLAAKEYWTLALVEADRSQIHENKIRMRNALGTLHMEMGYAETALVLFEEALSLLDSVGDVDKSATNQTKTLLNCLYASHHLGRTEDVWKYASMARVSADMQDDENLRARVYHNFSAVYPASEAWEEALVAGHEALRIYRNLGQSIHVAQVMLNIGVAKSGLHHPQARECFLEVVDLSRSEEDYLTLAFAYTELAKEALKEDKVEEALDYGRQALLVHWSHFSTLDKVEVARVIEVLGRVALKTGDRASGLNLLQRASTYYAQRNMWRDWSNLTKLIDDVVKPGSNVKTNIRSGAFSLQPEDREILDYFISIFSLLDVLEGMYPGMKGRSELVTRYALLLARYAGATQSDVETLSHAARLHDIGLTSVDLEVVDSLDTLTEAGRKRAQAHPAIGEQTLMGFPVPEGCPKVTRHHHENWDGTGYPDGLRADDIPWLSRILAVTDVYVSTALTSGHTSAMAALTEASGQRLDPQMVYQFGSIHRYDGD